MMVSRRRAMFEQSAVGVEAGAIENGVRGAEKVLMACSSRLCQVLRPANKTHRGHTVSVRLQPIRRRLPNIRMVGQPKIVIRTG